MKYRDIELKWGGQSGFLIKANSLNVYIDPFKLDNFENNLEKSDEKADIILITHSHYDHCSIEDIKKILKQETKIIGPADILSQTRQIKDGIDFEIAQPGKILNFNNIKINCFPSYNINKQFHPKNEGWLGYVIDLNNVRIYHAGDSDLIPEMKNIKADIALLPVGGKFTMDFNEAFRAAEIINPDLAIPMHFGCIIGQKNDAEKFVQLCKEKEINAVILEKEI